MRVLQAVLILALAATPFGASAAPPLVRPFTAPLVTHEAGAQRHAFWRHGGGDDGFGRHPRHDFFGPIGPIVAATGEAAQSAVNPAPSPFVVAAPIFVNVTFAPAAGPQREWADGPKLIEIGRQAPRHGHLPLIVYGD